MKKIFSFLIAMTAVFSMSAKTLYLHPNSNWNQANARFAIYAWDDKGDLWKDMAAVDGHAGYYQVSIDDNFTKVIFCRMNPATTENKWANKWNQTGDLVLEDAGENDLYTLTEGGDNWGDAGAWSKYVAPVGPQPKFYLTGTVFGEGAWDPNLTPCYDDSYTIEGLAANTEYKLKITLDGTWGTTKSYDDLTTTPEGVKTDGDNNIVFTLANAGDVVVTYTADPAVFTVEGDFKVVLPVVALAGTMTDWGEHPLVFVPEEGELTATVKVSLEQGDDTLKIVSDGKWLGEYGASGLYTIHRDWNHSTPKQINKSGDDIRLAADKAGEYTFTWTYADSTLVVTFPELTKSAVTISAPEHGVITVKNGDVLIGETVEERQILTITTSAKDGSLYDYKVTNLRAFKTGVEPIEYVGIDKFGNLIMPDCPITIAADEEAISYVIAGSADLVGVEWKPAAAENRMIRQEDGTYKLEKTEVALAATEYEYRLTIDGVYQGTENEKVNLTKSGEYTLTWTYSPSANTLTLVPVLTKEEEVKPSISLAASFAEELVVLTPSEDVAWITIPLAEGLHLFKIVKASEWMGKPYTVIKRNDAGYGYVDMTEHDNATNIEFWADKAGNYTFTWNYENNSLTIAYPERGDEAPAAWLAGQFGDEKAWAYRYLIRAEDNKSASIALYITAAGSYEFKMIVNNQYLSNGYTYHRDWNTSVVTGNVDENMVFNADVPGEYTVTWSYLNGSILFSFPPKDPTGIDNTEAGMKAEKVFENGQLVIIKGGVKYTVTGVELR